MKDFYYILGVNESSSPAEINEAYQKLSKKFDPHLNPGDQYFSTRFSEINDAYQVLIDPAKRSLYNTELADSKLDINRTVNTAANTYTPPYSIRRSRFKRPGTGTSIILLILALIIGAYLVKSLFSSKKHVVAEISVVNSAVSKPSVHHKKKYHGKKPAAVIVLRTKPDTVTKKPLSSAITTSPQIKQAKIAPVAAQPTANDIKKPSIGENTPAIKDQEANAVSGPFIYATTVQPNVTGIVNMRSSEFYNSVVITQVPANSKVYVLQKGRYYYKVSFDNKIGYVPKWSLEVK